MGYIKAVTVMAMVMLGLLLGGCVGSCGSCSSGACMDFWNAEDPCADGVCSKKERVAYALLGYECAKERGMVGISPKYNLPALECPIEVTIDCNAKCPPACYEIPGQEKPVASAETGFLLTVFDTPSGPQYVIIEAKQKFDPKTKLDEVAVKVEDVSRLLSKPKGKVAVYLTEFPLVLPDQNQQSRQLKDSEVAFIRGSLAGLGKNAEDVNFIRWK